MGAFKLKRFLVIIFVVLVVFYNKTTFADENSIKEEQIINTDDKQENTTPSKEKRKKRRKKEEKVETKIEEEKKEISTITADKLRNDGPKKTLLATGNVEIIKGQKIFHAESVSYNKESGTIKAEERVKLKDKELKTNIFAEKTELTDDITQGEFLNAGIIFENGSSITSPKLVMENENLFVMEKPIYSMCPTNIDFNLSYEELLEETSKKKSRLFSVTAKELSVDKENQFLNFKAAVIKVWKIPIFYLPYLKTSRPFGVKQTGFGSPSLESSSNYGYGVFVPYYLKFSDTHDLTITPGIYTKGNILLSFDYNLKKNDNYLKIDTSLIFDNGASKKIENTNYVSEKDEGEYQQLRGLFFLRSLYNFDDKWYFKTDLKLLSDTYALRDYRKDYAEYLESNIELNRIDAESTNYLSLNTLFFQEIKENRSNIGEQTPQYVPIIDFSYNTSQNKNNYTLTYKFEGNTTFIERTSGTDYKRFTIKPSVEAETIKYGSIFSTKLTLRGDIYLIDEDVTEDQKRYKDEKSRIIPEFELNWSLPIINKSKTLTFQPIIKYVYTPNTYKFEQYIPNEDSQQTEISHSNIFANSRYAGYDRMEYGNRISYGFIVNFYKKDYGNLNFILAQGYRDKNETTEQFRIKGFDEKVSDYVGGLTYNQKNLNLYYRFRIKKDNFDFQKNEIGLDYDFKKLTLSSTYTMNKKENMEDEEGEQWSYGAKLNVYGHWNVSYLETIDFLGKNRIIERRASIEYNGNCVRFEFVYAEDNPREFPKPDRSFKFNYAVKTSLF